MELTELVPEPPAGRIFERVLQARDRRRGGRRPGAPRRDRALAPGRRLRGPARRRLRRARSVDRAPAAAAGRVMAALRRAGGGAHVLQRPRAVLGRAAHDRGRRSGASTPSRSGSGSTRPGARRGSAIASSPCTRRARASAARQYACAIPSRRATASARSGRSAPPTSTSPATSTTRTTGSRSRSASRMRPRTRSTPRSSTAIPRSRGRPMWSRTAPGSGSWAPRAPSTPRFRSPRAAEGRRSGGHSAGGRSGRATFSGLPARQLGQQLGDLRRAELRPDRGPGDLDHGVAVAGAHQVAAHRP